MENMEYVTYSFRQVPFLSSFTTVFSVLSSDQVTKRGVECVKIRDVWIQWGAVVHSVDDLPYCPLQRVFDILHNDLCNLFVAYVAVARTAGERGDKGNDVNRYSSPRTLPRTLVRQAEKGMADVPVVSISHITDASTCCFLFRFV
ncbi:hypothetical protein LOAG_14104 [Loa loa]|uniref:Uncharacterized protein n=1 Tax=Loa loa TaxID=7209 RepID=A0A1S0TIS4_LOALO|nr:hypothetical protein LOAG_14104 [Loa loa]EFO14414.1 hypothetical protein LOAG_14104 [Loa loa]